MKPGTVQLDLSPRLLVIEIVWLNRGGWTM
jgi:hypothetical protein